MYTKKDTWIQRPAPWGPAIKTDFIKKSGYL